MTRRIAKSELARLNARMRTIQSNPSVPSFARSDYVDVRAFFDEASRDYDSDLVNPYWSFTHEILRHILRTFIRAHFPEHATIRLFDAGAGTGNWSRYVLSLNPRIHGTLFDMNPNMLKVAYPKVTSEHGASVRIIEGNLETWSDYPTDQPNLILCMHNVIGLGRNSDRMLANLCRHLAENGLAFIMAPNAYHCFNFTNRFRGVVEAQRVVHDRTVKFKDDMPEMFCYTPIELEQTLRRAGFSSVTVLGYPVTVYPGMQDTKLLNQKTTDQQLTDPATRSRLLALEKHLCLDPELAYRGGSSLIAICKKAV